jgi:hypothetical protein
MEGAKISFQHSGAAALSYKKAPLFKDRAFFMNFS